MLNIGDTVWTFDSFTPEILGPLTVSKVEKNGVCEATGNKKVRLSKGDFYVSRADAAKNAKSYYEQQARSKQLALNRFNAKLDNLCEKEGV